MPRLRAVLAGAPRATALDRARREGAPAHWDRVGELPREAGTNRGGRGGGMFHVFDITALHTVISRPHSRVKVPSITLLTCALLTSIR